MGAKRLGLLHELIPAASPIGVLINPNFADAHIQLAVPARQIRLPRRCVNHAPGYSESAMTDSFGITALRDASSITRRSPAIMTQDVA